MALNATRLSAAILAAVTADPLNGFSSPLSVTQTAMIKAWTDAIATAVIAEFTGFAAVAVTVASVTGVTVGVGVSGPGSGSGTIS